ncbi:general stress protein [Halomonas sp. E19]|uniref:general stress protein n=1 Tax=unclassified Halomonas TaxID=2609666 RepID=UPI0040332B69
MLQFLLITYFEVNGETSRAGMPIKGSTDCTGTPCSVCSTNLKESVMAQRNQNPGNFANDPKKAAEAGRKGGQNSGGNFANDPEKASEAGRKGGQNSGGNFANDTQKASSAGQKGGKNSGGNFANDRQKAAEAGRKGGKSQGH